MEQAIQHGDYKPEPVVEPIIPELLGKPVIPKIDPVDDIIKFIEGVGSTPEQRRIYASTAAHAYATAYNEFVEKGQAIGPKIEPQSFEVTVLEAYDERQKKGEQ